ncbi:MAG: DUF4860 domain-containing protein [Clostridiales bacterium]|jgi:hypothetical protein|nr:DUF4860 domain-containing protein [Clostridiales bacterium]
MKRFGLTEAKDSESGSGMIELMMVMTLMLLFGVTIYQIILMGSDTLQRIETQRNAQSDARVALSYLNVRTKQFDGADQVTIKPNGVNGQNSLAFRYRHEEAEYDLWVFWADGQLMEAIAGVDEEPDWFGASTIARINSFETVLENQVLKNTITYTYGRKEHEMSNMLYIRSYGT